jgi:cell wall-associated NlpC family hydrolase
MLFYTTRGKNISFVLTDVLLRWKMKKEIIKMSFLFNKRLAALTLGLTMLGSSVVFASNTGTISGTDVNIRASNSTDAYVLSTADDGEQVTILADLDGWFRISAPNVGTAYVTSQFVKVQQADGTVTGNSVNIRTSPSTSAQVIGQANSGDLLNVTGTSGEWYVVDYNGTKAYVYKSYVNGDMLKYLDGTSAAVSTPASSVSTSTSTNTNNVYAVVNCSGSLNLRSAASTSSNVVASLSSGYNLSVYEYEDGWIKVSDDEGHTGYVKSDFITLKNGTKPANTTTTTVQSASASSKAAQIIAYAKQYIGTPYVYGGTNLNTGVDCSGFTYCIFKNNGVTINRSSREQYKNGVSVSKSDLQPGDLVFFNTGGDTAISHVGMYIGNGQYIHSTDGGNKGVCISNLSDSYSAKTYYGARRVLN